MMRMFRSRVGLALALMADLLLYGGPLHPGDASKAELMEIRLSLRAISTGSLTKEEDRK